MILFVIILFLLLLVFIVIYSFFKNKECVEFSEDTMRDWDEYEMLKPMDCEQKQKLVTAEYINGDKMYKHVYGDAYRDASGHLHCDKIYTYDLEYLETTTLDDTSYKTYCTSYEPDLLNNEIIIHKNPLPTNCKNCGAPLHSHECEYCGSEYY